MKCKKTKKLILKNWRKGKDSRKKKALDKHLSICEDCREYKERWEMLVKGIEKFDIKAKAPEGFTQRTTARAWMESKTKKRLPGKRFAFASFAGAAVAALLLFTILPRKADEQVFWMASNSNMGNILSTYSSNSRIYNSATGYIKLNFRSAAELKGVTVNMHLPEGLVLYDGRSSIENWKMDLNEGDNVVFMKVKSRRPGLWNLEGVIEKDGAKSRFSKEVEVI